MISQNAFYAAHEMRTIDQRAMALGFDEKTLILRAAEAVCAVCEEQSQSGAVTVLCGPGNNGADGWALAWLLLKKKRSVRVLSTETIKQGANTLFCAEGGEWMVYGTDATRGNEWLDQSVLIVDALFGFSFHGELPSDAAAMISHSAAGKAVVVAVDLPSGITADGICAEGCTKADITVTFTANKPATVSYPALSYCGRVILADIGVPASALVDVEPAGRLLDDTVLQWIPPREMNSHKGTFGTLLALCGSVNMPGAAYLACLGALRSGVGLVKLSADDETLAVLKNRLAEPVWLPYRPNVFLEEKQNALLVGCGISDRYDEDLPAILKAQKTSTIIDADGINYIARHKNVLMEMQGDIILTPHPGEMARLIDSDIESVNRHRLECARAFAGKYHCVLVLKGNRTVVAAPDGRIYVNTTGCSALAKGGSGDVLAGVIASLAAQGIPAVQAACLGVYLHGRAAEKLCETYGAHGLLPHDLPAEIGRLLG